ncbi:hypothetical protein SAMN00120144_1970 [Hymenobacter roseosalivarius DSM 11622]|uniref:DUF7149 domain-containing protein n=1 Tax=Hymenobacter roseosalivarius DSM 11622 TaxID=645990 RepID=A0A1W1W431_9BACT|nr:hypothetical protein [Hymenobacter roseosalivarius]SMC00356.1 hypothetical protein SAMN00120144_1970 [Hymenobacter roseosalivarius DSM 11622]
MKVAPQQPSQALDLAYRRQKVARATLDTFENARRQLLTDLDPQQDEADIIEPLRRFLHAVGFNNFLNSRKKRDLIMHTGPAATDPIGVLFELKHQKNKGEMVQPTNLNRKALHELLLYYFQERTSEQQLPELRQLVITTGYDWFVFDAHEFHRVFWKYSELRGGLFRSSSRARPRPAAPISFTETLPSPCSTSSKRRFALPISPSIRATRKASAPASASGACCG